MKIVEVENKTNKWTHVSMISYQPILFPSNNLFSLFPLFAFFSYIFLFG